MSGRVLVAGIGNIFLGDDGFGVEVASRLSRAELPDRVRVLDAGIRARDLAYQLVEGGYDTAILVDAVARGGTPGTVYVIEPEAPPLAAVSTAALNGHAMNPEATLALVQALGGVPTRILIVGCEPATVEEGVGLSDPVAAAVDEAIGVVRELLCA
jgi:hydrogenase maturation protease